MPIPIRVWIAGWVLFLAIVAPGAARQWLSDQPIYVRPAEVESRSASFENPTGGKGTGGRENQGAKGHFLEPLEAGTNRADR